MSSIIQSMSMGTPTIHRRPSVTAQLLSAAGLVLGLALSSSPHFSSHLSGVALAGIAGLSMWQSHRRTQQTLQRTLQTERLWQAVANGCEVGVMTLAARRDQVGRFEGYEIVQANARSQALFNAEAPLKGQLLLDVLPSHLHATFLHRLTCAIELHQAQIEEHAFTRPGAQSPSRWLHHQIVPLGDGLAVISRDTSEAHQAMSAAREQTAFYRTLVDCLPMAVYARSTRPSSAGEYVVWNKAAAEVMQLPADKVLGRKASDLMSLDVSRRGDEQDLAVLRDPRIHQFPNLVYQTPKGERIVDLIKAPVYGVDGEVDHILSIARDVTDQRQAAEQLKLASRVIDETGDAVVVSDAVDRVVMVNPAFLNLTGMTPAEVIGRSAELLGMPPLRESHLPGVTQALRGSQRWSGESRQVCQDGQTLDTWLSVSTLRNDLQKVTQHIRVFSDISVLKAHQRELAEQARHDSLTGLPNRRAFGERLNQAMARARRNPQALGVLYIDLDGFKGVNDRYGHAAGDRLLAEVAKRLLTCVRLTDCVCRLAGDEFTVILEGAGNPGEVVRICQRIVERVSVPHDMAGDSVIVSPSIGAAILQAGESAEAFCQRADAAMYAAKHAGKAGFIMSKDPVASDGETMPLLRQATI
ncbi:MAG: diguanylate cyclase [Aquabacterium sp.]|uniref:sensor domain-containing protein n=1 Tax=Aquabacterium sp. TaxID=1872578 RepID=UPI0012096ACB|nr:sensor domain-containing diguanylate cyclase [Aquabacterium sp.]TAK98308.1 MAG: diguanylate cyclase [Aquabacterium sp.]